MSPHDFCIWMTGYLSTTPQHHPEIKKIKNALSTVDLKADPISEYNQSVMANPKCAICGMPFAGSIGYACNNSECPMGVSYSVRSSTRNARY